MSLASPRQRSLRGLTVLFLLATACGSDADRTLRIIKGAAIKDGVVTGFVIDDETEIPVPAEVLVGGTPVRAQSDGSFAAPATAGRVRVEVRSEGYLKTFRDVAVGGRSLPMPFKVARRAPKQVVGQAGGRFTYRDATLEIPAGAFTADTGVALTHLSRVRVAAIAATPQFIDQQGIPRRAVALVDLAADQQPAMAVRARVPVPADADIDSISGFVVDALGNWTTPISPDSVNGGFAEFILAGDLQIGVAVDVRRADGKKIGYLVTDKGGSTSAQGDVVGSGELVAGTRAAAIVDPQGSRVEMAPGTRARVEVPDETGTATRAPYAGTVAVAAGRARVVVAPPPADAPKVVKLTVKGNAGQFDVKGTAFSVVTCGVAPNVVDLLEVGEGLVAVTAGGKTEEIGANETAVVCSDCSDATVAMCTPAQEDGGTPPATGDGSAPNGRDASPGSDGGTVPGPDGGATPPDASSGIDATGADTSTGGGPDMGVVVPPDAGPQPDTAVKLDVATPAPDTAAPTPDVAVLAPDTAVIQPDAAQPAPDTAAPPVDAAQPSLDVAFDSQSIPVDATVAMFSINPGKQDFGSITVGQTSAPVSFTITNRGDLPSGTPNVGITGDFAVSSNGCGALPANASCTVGVTFKPAGTGARSGNLNVTSTDGNTFSASLSGTGMPPTPGQFKLTPLANNYGYRQMNRVSGDVIFTLSNTGQQPTAKPILAIGDKDAADFAFNPAVPRGGYCPDPLPPGGSCTIPVRFAPKSAGGITGLSSKNALLNVTGTPGGPVSATLSGTSTLAVNGLEIDPPHLDVGPVAVGTFGEVTFTLRNIGAIDIRIINFTMSTPHQQAPEWTLNTQDCIGTLNPPAGPRPSCKVIARFSHRVPTGLRQIEWQAHGQPVQGGATADAAAHVQATAQ